MKAPRQRDANSNRKVLATNGLCIALHGTRSVVYAIRIWVRFVDFTFRTTAQFPFFGSACACGEPVESVPACVASCPSLFQRTKPSRPYYDFQLASNKIINSRYSAFPFPEGLPAVGGAGVGALPNLAFRSTLHASTFTPISKSGSACSLHVPPVGSACPELAEGLPPDYTLRHRSE